MECIVSFDAPQEVYLFPGMQLNWLDDGSLKIGMSDYGGSIVTSFEKRHGKVPVVCSPVDHDVRDATDAELLATKGELAFVRHILGMVLWLARCARPDLSYSSSMLAGRLTTWNNECSAQLKRLVGFIKFTVKKGLHYTAPQQVIPERDWVVEAQCDSDHRAPRSQSGSM